MSNHFYRQIVNIDVIDEQINLLDLDEGEKRELKDLARLNLHHAIIDAILNELGDEQKKQFLINLSEGNHTKTLQHLEKNIKNVESIIKIASAQLSAELHADIREVKHQK